MKRYFVVVFLVLVASVIYFTKGFASRLNKPLYQENESETSCYSLDVVFIIDQSDSMSDQGGFIPNDPTEQRSYAPRWAIDWLADNAYDICEDAIHRVAVVSFGTDATLDLMLSEIDPDNVDEYVRVRQNLKENISAKAMGFTDPKLAFDLAKQVLDDAGPLPGGGNRKRVIIFMTDGEPCVESLGCRPPTNTMNFIQYAKEMREQVKNDFPFSETLLAQENCLRGLREYYEGGEIPPEKINQCLEEHRVDPGEYEDSIYLWTMLLRKGSTYSRLLREEYKGMTEEHGGELVDLTENRQDIPSTFLDILTRLSGVQATRLSCGNFAVNPYLRQARLVFFKISEDTTVRLAYTDAFGKVHEIVDGKSTGGFDIAEHYSEGTNERYVINTPYPGIWAFESDACEGVDAYYEEMKFDIGGLQPMSILTPDGQAAPPEATYSALPIIKYGHDPYYDIESPYYLQYQMHDLEGNIIPDTENPFFGVNFDVQVTDPSGKVIPYEMEWNAGESLFRSTSPLILPVQGEYTVKISGDTVHRDYPYGPIGRNLILENVYTSSRHLFDYNAKFNVVCPGLDLVNRCPWETYVAEDGCSVCPIKNFEISIFSPEEGLVGTVHEPISGGWPLAVKPVDFRFKIDGQGGENLPLDEILSDPAQPVRVTVNAAGTEKVLSYSRDSNTANTYTGSIEGMDIEGPYHLKVALTSAYNEFYRPIGDSAERDFTRSDELWTRASTYLTILYILIGIIMLLIVYNILIRTNRVRGALVFAHYDGEVIANLSINSDKNWKIISGRKLDAYPQLDLKRIRASNAGKAARAKRGTQVDVLESIEGFSNSSQPGVRVEFTPRGGHRFTELLQPNQPIPFSAHGEENLFQVEYRRD